MCIRDSSPAHELADAILRQARTLAERFHEGLIRGGRDVADRIDQGAVEVEHEEANHRTTPRRHFEQIFLQASGEMYPRAAIDWHWSHGRSDGFRSEG